MNASLVATLLEDGKAVLKDCYSEKTGRTYDAVVRLVDNGQQTSFVIELGWGYRFSK